MPKGFWPTSIFAAVAIAALAEPLHAGELFAARAGDGDGDRQGDSILPEKPPTHPPTVTQTEKEWSLTIEPMLWLPALRRDIKMPGGPTFDLANLSLDESRFAPAGQATFRTGNWSAQIIGFGFGVEETATAGQVILPAGPVTINPGDLVHTDLDYIGIEATAEYQFWTPIDDYGDDMARRVRLAFDLL
ncbi:MAG TPA: hypothetical protein VG797_09725, partial [Phycisphaerales bacterium]|nr:hypothetical protein [Phycisphaerales bacterium]